MGTTATQISLSGMDPDIPKSPKLALTSEYLFWTFKDNGNVVLRWSKLDPRTGGITSISPKITLFPIGNMVELRIIGRGNIALVAAIDSVGGTNTVKGAVGKVSGAPPVFTPRRCPDRVLPAGQIVDILCRINDDETSDDLVCVMAGGNAAGAYGHHPPP
jgi:hypothetical protein